MFSIWLHCIVFMLYVSLSNKYFCLKSVYFDSKVWFLWFKNIIRHLYTVKNVTLNNAGVSNHISTHYNECNQDNNLYILIYFHNKTFLLFKIDQ